MSDRSSPKLIAISFIFLLIIANISIITISSRIAVKTYNDPHYFNISNDNGSESIYDLLMISPQKFSNSLKPLVDHKNNYGVKTIQVNIEEVYQQIFWKGRDNAEKIKYFIKEAIEQWGIRYVLLVGGRQDQSRQETWWIPVRYSYINRGYLRENNVLLPEEKFISDLYYADIYDENGIFSSWDDNNNCIFGEWPVNESAVDIPDLTPDIFVGRLPCRTVFDVKTIVKKIINYETGNFSDSWFKKMVVIAGDTYPDKTDYYDGEAYTQMGLDMMPGFEPVKLWTSTGTLKNWHDIVKAINQGCGFVWFSGHGNSVSWSTHPPNDSSAWIGKFRLWHMLFLRNRGKLPICIAGSGCFVSMFNVSLGHSERAYWQGLPINVPRCWSWSLARKIGGGSIATIGSTAFSYESPDIDSGFGGCEWLDMQFFGEYGLKGTDILGETWGNTVTSFVQNFTINWSDDSSNGDALIVKNVEQWVLIGDPSLKIGGYN
ncbi:Peptidase C25, gingipain [Thermoplasmatales archaeon SCGC AB-539-N05]|nr:Peptidase C25, gingipain [Thermoplasmatales archaeon SCGC AB-539-N05]